MNPEQFAKQLVQEFIADREEAFNRFWLSILNAGAGELYISTRLKTTIHHAYDIGYVDAINTLIDRKMVKLS
jgi:hypothetical protein